MALYLVKDDTLKDVPDSSFASLDIKERDIQSMLRERIEIITPDAMVIAEEYSSWADSNRRVDLLCLDREANLVVVELKRTQDGGHMELQAIRYAAMVSNMTFGQLVEAHEAYLYRRGEDPDQAQDLILDFLGLPEPDEDRFPSDVKMVLVSQEFSTEITSAVLWLNERGIEMRCIQMTPRTMQGETLIDFTQVVPLPTAQEYQVTIRQKAHARRDEKAVRGVWSGFWHVNVGDKFENRSWNDCRRYGFLSAGGGKKWSGQIKPIAVGDYVCAYCTGTGYVGVGRVIADAVPMREFIPPGSDKKFIELSYEASVFIEHLDNDERCDWCIAVEWVETLDRENAVLSSHAQRGTACKLRQVDKLRDILEAFGVTDLLMEAGDTG